MTTRRAQAQNKSKPSGNKARPARSKDDPQDDAQNDSPARPTSRSPLQQVMRGRPGFLIRRLNQIGAALFYDECQSESLTPLQIGMLTALSMNPWLDQKAIGRELALDRTTVAEVLRRLGEKGLVETRVNPDDRRSKLSVITKEGLKLIRELQGSINKSQERLVDPLTPVERVALMTLLSKLVDAHEQMDDRT